jgi:hypothetical protein
VAKTGDPLWDAIEALKREVETLKREINALKQAPATAGILGGVLTRPVRALES